MNSTRTLTPPKAVLFDWDNTLVDTWPVIHQALNATLRFMEHPEWSMERVRRDVQHSMRDAFPALFGDRWEIAADRYQQEYKAIHMQALKPLESAEETLKTLQKQKLYVALVSNKRGPTLRKESEALGWEPYFSAHIGSQDAEADKPDAAPAHMALIGAPVKEGSEIWFVGDSGVDLECAARIGATPILYGDVETDGFYYKGFPFAAHAKNQEELRALFTNALAG